MESRNHNDFPAAARQRLPRSGSRPVAVIASDHALRSSVALLLTVAGITVVAHRSIRACLAAGQASYGLLVVDYHTGDPTIRRPFMDLLRRGERTPIVAMTTVPDVLAAVASEHPNLRLVGKPFESDHFIDIVRALHDSKGDSGDPQFMLPETSR